MIHKNDPVDLQLDPQQVTHNGENQTDISPDIPEHSSVTSPANNPSDGSPANNSSALSPINTDPSDISPADQTIRKDEHSMINFSNTVEGDNLAKIWV